MLCIEIHTTADGFTSIRATDQQGICFALCGYDRWPFWTLAHEQNIFI